MILDTLRVLGSNLAVNLSSFLVLALAGRIMSIEEFAKLSLIVAGSQLLSSALDLGTNVGTVKKYAESKEGRFLSALVWIKVAVACCCCGGLVIGYKLGVPPAWLIVLACAASIDLWSGARALDQARMDFSGLAQANIAFAALRCVLGIAGLATGSAFMVAMAFFIGPLLAVAAYKWRTTAALTDRFDADTAREVLHYAWPVYVSAILFTLALYYPQFVIARQLDASAVATFGVLLIFLGPLGLINASVRIYLLPRFAGKEVKRADVLANPRAMAMIVGVLVLALIGVAIGALLIEQIYGARYPGIGLPFWVFISLWLLTLYLGVFNLDVHRLGRVDAEAWVNAARLATLIIALWLFGRDLLSIVIVSAFIMFAGECVLFMVIGHLARRERASASTPWNGQSQSGRTSPREGVHVATDQTDRHSLIGPFENGKRAAGAPLRFAVVCTNPNWRPWELRCVELLAKNRSGDLVGVVHLTATSTMNSSAEDADDTRRPVGPPPDPVDEETSGVIACSGSDDGCGGWSLDGAGVATVRALKLDFMLIFGIERMRGDVLDAARHGVWCFPGFGATADEHSAPVSRPVHDMGPLTAVALVRLSRSIGEDVVLKRGLLRTQPSRRKNFNAAMTTVSEWPASVASLLIAGGGAEFETFTTAEWHYAVAPPPADRGWQTATKVISRLAHSTARFAFSYEEWRVGVARTDLQEILRNGAPADITWAPAPGFGRFYADPMAFETASGTTVYCEHYSYWSGKGDLRALHFAADDGFSERVEPFISEPFHLSYPAVLELGSRKVCVPECCEAGVVYAYPLDVHGKIAGDRAVLVPFEVADPTFVQHAGLWYLFGASAAEAQYNLRIWYANTLDGPWAPHPANPVKCDVGSARCAGPFVRDGGRLYRPSQNSSVSYGASANLMEVVELSPTAFKEVLVKAIHPNRRWEYNQGIHTVTLMRDGVLLDAKLVHVSPLALLLRGVNYLQTRRRRLFSVCERTATLAGALATSKDQAVVPGDARIADEPAAECDPAQMPTDRLRRGARQP